jgi:DeoR family transcriptional regulator, aga operon transcriptional repressor
MAIAGALKKFFHLTIITNAVNIAAELGGTDFEVLLTGGSLRKNSFSLVGPLAEEMLHDMHADILLLGVDGFDLEIGLTTPNVMESRVNRAMVKAAKTNCRGLRFDQIQSSELVKDRGCKFDPSRHY